MAVCAAAVEVHDIVISCLLCRVLHQPSPGPFCLDFISLNIRILCVDERSYYLLSVVTVQSMLVPSYLLHTDLFSM